ncbi:MAG: methyltransferase domain-containing protein [Prochlorotrichaceae cyanobacterium]
MTTLVDTPNSTPQPLLHREWMAYYEAVKGRPPRDTLRFALDRFDLIPESQSSSQTRQINSSRFAVDLGCGDGRDTVEILRRGWQVLAIDGSPEAIDRLLQRPDVDPTAFQTRVEKFESLTLAPNSTDLVNASFCLPFCSAEQFSTLWATIVDSLHVGGRLSCHLYGDRDSWRKYPNLCFHRYAQVQDLLTAFDLEWFKEEEHPGVTPLGEERYWHIFHIVARKR